MRMAHSRPAPGGGVVVEVPADRLVGWVNRFAGRNDGLAVVTGGPDVVTLTGGDGTTATVAVPFPPMSINHREPIEAVLDHIAGVGTVGVVLVRGGAHSVGVVREGVVLSSSTDRAYLQGRTAAGGWSQQRYARRRGNQLKASRQDAADTAARVLGPIAPTLDALVLGGDAGGVRAVMEDPRLAALDTLPRRFFGDIPEPRRAVLDALAARYRTLDITIRPPSR
jgi:hypothetical protein